MTFRRSNFPREFLQSRLLSAPSELFCNLLISASSICNDLQTLLYMPFLLSPVFSADYKLFSKNTRGGGTCGAARFSPYSVWN
jgi:hypothetical protein